MTKRNVKDPEERKQELIDIASSLFEKYGYEKVSVRDILAEVNGAPGMFYYYFKSKE
ncbi:TetR/AcrR family transcriptional regulator, partial [Anaerococcus octavius]|uniref:TetR/AcrR family transcriptional regulator n=2 Tax=Peptoniphilaceae TaxID=1570339 RepID=UPI002356A0B2